MINRFFLLILLPVLVPVLVGPILGIAGTTVLEPVGITHFEISQSLSPHSLVRNPTDRCELFLKTLIYDWHTDERSGMACLVCDCATSGPVG